MFTVCVSLLCLFTPRVILYKHTGNTLWFKTIKLLYLVSVCLQSNCAQILKTSQLCQLHTKLVHVLEKLDDSECEEESDTKSWHSRKQNIKVILIEKPVEEKSLPTPEA